jgi:hypothetical protein
VILDPAVRIENVQSSGLTKEISELVRKYPNGVIPAKAGIQSAVRKNLCEYWIPAFAGMT